MPHSFFNININILNDNDFIKYLFSNSGLEKNKIFFYLNSYSLYLYDKLPEFQKAFNIADYVLPDGASIKYGLKLLNKANVEKVTFTHLFFTKLEELMISEKSSLYLLGSKPEVINQAANKLLKKGLIIKGFHDGYFTNAESDLICNEINSSGAKILLVGMGMPKSEIWVANNIHKLNIPNIVTVGNFFEIVSGNVKLAPRFLYNSGLEWVYRLIQEPNRLFKRYLYSNTYFLKKILSELLNVKN